MNIYAGKLYHVVTYGCQMNVHESEKLAGILEKLGYTVSDSIYDADVVVFNTCCIRESAEQKIFGNIGDLKKNKHPQEVAAFEEHFREFQVRLLCKCFHFANTLAFRL